MAVERKAQVEILPDLGALSDEELKQLKLDLEAKEHDVSYQRRVLHGQIDILRAEIVARLQRTGGLSVLDELDVERLSEILSGKVAPPE
jgi:anti-sigma-K factor RsiG